MPKLNETQAKKVDDASSDFEPLPEGVYHCRLANVDGSGEGNAGPYWSWEFDVVEPGDYLNRKLWNNTSLAEQSAFALQNTFQAFGVDSDTDTDELHGEVVRVQVSIQTIEKGARKGQLTNNVEKLFSKDEDFELPDGVNAAAEPGQPNPEDIFN